MSQSELPVGGPPPSSLLSTSTGPARQQPPPPNPFSEFRRVSLNARGASMWSRNGPKEQWMRLADPPFGAVEVGEETYNVEDLAITGEHVEVRQWGDAYERSKTDKGVATKPDTCFCWCVRFPHHAIENRVVHEIKRGDNVSDIELRFTTAALPVSVEDSCKAKKTVEKLAREMDEADEIARRIAGEEVEEIEETQDDEEMAEEMVEVSGEEEPQEAYPATYPLALLFEDPDKAAGIEIKLVFRRGGASKRANFKFSWYALISFLCGKGPWFVRNEEQQKRETKSLYDFLQDQQGIAKIAAFKEFKRHDKARELEWTVTPKQAVLDPATRATTSAASAPQQPLPPAPPPPPPAPLTPAMTSAQQKRKALSEDPGLDDLAEAFESATIALDEGKKVTAKAEQDADHYIRIRDQARQSEASLRAECDDLGRQMLGSYKKSKPRNE